MLFRKVIRDLRINATQFIAIFVMTFFAMFITGGFDADSGSSTGMGTKYLEDMNFKDLSVTGAAFGYEHISVLENTQGVKCVNGVLHASGKALLDEERPMVFSFISGDDVSKMLLTDGEAYKEGASGVWLEKIFADSMNLSPGDTINIKIDNFSLKEEIKGLVYSPEYIYYMPNASYTEPEYGSHGFAILDISEAPFGEVYFDELMVDLTDVNGQFESLTSKEEVTMAYMKNVVKNRLDQKNLMVTDKTEDEGYYSFTSASGSMEGIALIFSGMFIVVAMFGIITTMTRITGNQRIQIGTLKALGFSKKAVTLHYLSYSAIVTALGAVTGIIVGKYTLGAYLNSITDYYYQNPYSHIQLSYKSVIFPIIAVMMSILTTYICTGKLLKENASEILRPAPPKKGSTGVLESLKFWEKLKFGTRWNIRDVDKNRLRTVMSILGIIVTSMLLFAAFSFYECIDGMPGWMYGKTVNANYRILFEDGTDPGIVYDYAKEYDGQMLQFESVNLFTDTAQSVRFMTVCDAGNLFHVQDEKLKYIDIPEHGVLLTTRLKDYFGVEKGDEISWQMPGDSTVYTARIAGFVRQASDQGILLSKEAFREIRGEFSPNLIYTNKTVLKDLVNRAEITAVNTNSEMRQSLSAAWNSAFTVSVIISMVAVILGVVVLYNLGVLSYIEKTREIATMKVLGFQSDNIRKILMQQNLTVTVLGAVIGVPAGRVALSLILEAMLYLDGDALVKLSPLPYVVAVVGTFFVSMLVNLFVTSKVKDIDMVEALKGVE